MLTEKQSTLRLELARVIELTQHLPGHMWGEDRFVLRKNLTERTRVVAHVLFCEVCTRLSRKAQEKNKKKVADTLEVKSEPQKAETNLNKT